MKTVFLVLAFLKFIYGQLDNPCDSNPCKNGDCIIDNSTAGFRCNCIPGFTGQQCSIDIDGCLSSPCGQNGLCSDGINMFTCFCSAGFTGATCEFNLSDPCSTLPCLNGATCENLGQDSFICTCSVGFTGQTCDANIDDCSPNPCQNGGMCIDLINAFECQCPPGYTGQICDTDIDDCSTNPCQNNGVCIDKINAFECKCIPGFTGEICDIDIDECASTPCQNGGHCINLVNRFICFCLAPFSGASCDVAPPDPCSSSPCQNGGQCVTSVSYGHYGFTCGCAPGYEGDLCERKQSCQDSKLCCAVRNNVYEIVPGTKCRYFMQSVTFGKRTYSYKVYCPHYTVFDTNKCVCNWNIQATCYAP